MQSSSKTTAILLSVFVAISAVAQPVKVDRYDDADEYLPTAEKRNKNNIRLFLRQQDSEQIFKVLTPRNVTVDVVAHVPADAEHGVVFLLGGTSVLSIANDKLDRSFSFQPRSRDYWWKHKFATFLVDAPSDRLGKDGIQDTVWRAGKDHATDLRAVIDAIGEKFKGPLVIHGHSNGATSLANVAKQNLPNVKGFVYSSAAHKQRGAELIYEVDHNAPVLFVHHKNDTCRVSPFSSLPELQEKVRANEKKMLIVEGGIESMSGACGPFAPHSFVGQEASTIDDIVAQLRLLIKK